MSDIEIIDICEEERKSKLPRKKKKGKSIFIIFGILVLLAGVVIAGVFYEDSLVYKTIRVEAGIDVAAQDCLKKEDPKAYYTKNSSPFDCTIPGEYELEIYTGFFPHKCKLIIEDTLPPTLELHDVDVIYGQTVSLEAFVSSVDDKTQVKLSYNEEPDFNSFGQQTVGIMATDAGNNFTTANATLTVVCVNEEVEIGLGEAVPGIEAFDLSGKGALLSDLSLIDSSVCGEYDVDISVLDKVYTSKLIVADHVPPVFAVKDIAELKGYPRLAEEFVTECEDDTEVTFSFMNPLDVNIEGEQVVDIVATDAYGNSSTQSAKLTLSVDNVAPTISGASNVIAFLGDTISYRSYVQVADNASVLPELIVDSSAVNPTVAGTYNVEYVATDMVGNESRFTLNLELREHVYADDMKALSDSIAARICTDDLSTRDKVYAIFTYVRGHLSYSGTSDFIDWQKNAYDGFTKGVGDCYTYAAMTRALLDSAGIENFEIRCIHDGGNEHAWNVVDIGDGHGWYHLDTTPRIDGTTFFLLDDAQLKSYSDTHGNSHNYERDKYPTIP